MKRALISVSDKTGVVEFARSLHGLGYEIISTGGTAAHLEAAAIPVIHVDEVTKFPECLDGRVKTLHPMIFGPLLGRRDLPAHREQMALYGMQAIDLIAVNLYPFRQTVLRTNKSRQECVEQIDIGGPSMLRAAAKNYQDVLVVCDPRDYDRVIGSLTEGEAGIDLRFELALKVFEQTAAYDAVIAEWLRSEAEGSGLDLEPGAAFTASYIHLAKLRYGENPQQGADYYQTALPVPGSLTGAEQLSGKELSYNNIADTDAALALVREFDRPCIVAVKHANPCGVGVCDNLIGAWTKAYECDPVSIFGGIVAANRIVEADVATRMNEIFLEVVVAPDFTAEALTILKQKPNLRLMKLPDLTEGFCRRKLKDVLGGLLVQDEDNEADDRNWSVPTKIKPLEAQNADLLFGMKVVKHVKSNAIVLVKDGATVGIGAGQMNRVQSARIAIEQAGDKAQGAILASDAFYPFADTVAEAHRAGVAAIIQPGGSLKDADSIEYCDTNGLPMVLTGVRHFRH
jgi:phosphoribosylaminoimidazolecarboxamide formyltransferase/IMP cyclohydrolase